MTVLNTSIQQSMTDFNTSAQQFTTSCNIPTQLYPEITPQFNITQFNDEPAPQFNYQHNPPLSANNIPSLNTSQSEIFRFQIPRFKIIVVPDTSPMFYFI
jgi:hypothetical protein